MSSSVGHEDQGTLCPNCEKVGLRVVERFGRIMPTCPHGCAWMISFESWADALGWFRFVKRDNYRQGRKQREK